MGPVLRSILRHPSISELFQGKVKRKTLHLILFASMIPCFPVGFPLNQSIEVMMLPSLSKSLEQAFTITVAEPMNFRGWANRQQPAPGHKGNRCETQYLGDSLGFV